MKKNALIFVLATICLLIFVGVLFFSTFLDKYIIAYPSLSLLAVLVFGGTYGGWAHKMLYSERWW